MNLNIWILDLYCCLFSFGSFGAKPNIQILIFTICFIDSLPNIQAPVQQLDVRIRQ